MSARNRPVRLLEVGLDWPPETFLQWRFEGLAAHGVRVTVASAALRQPGARARVPGARLLRIPHWQEPWLRKLVGVVWQGLLLALTHPSRARRLLSAVRRPALLRSYLRLARVSPDLVHIEWPTAGVHYLPLFEIWGCPVVVSCHGDVGIDALVPGNRWAAGMPLLFERAAAVHGVSEATLRQATPYGVTPSRSALIRPAVDPAVFRPPPDGRRPGGVLRVVSVGRLRWEKGFEYGLATVRLLCERGVPVRWEVAGEGEDRARILETIEDLDLGEHVRLSGAVPSEGVRKRLHAADVLLQPSLSEGIPTTVLEAMACALPVVVTDCGGLREAVTDGREGVVVAPRDPAAMADALEALWRSPEQRAAMGAAGRARVVADFALAPQVERFLDLYRRLAAAPR